MTAEVLVALILVLLLGILALLLWSWKRGEQSQRFRENHDDPTIDEGTGIGTECPLCGAFLPRGTRVYSVIFPGREFDLMRIYGCPNCRETLPDDGISPVSAPPVKRKRHCPHCGGELPPGGYVMAKVYRKPYRKTHVHVYGCTVCKPGRG